MAVSRCKSCGVDLSGDATMLRRLSQLLSWKIDRPLCEPCFLRISSRSGPDQPVSLLFADVRIPETLAERTPSRDFRTFLRRLYQVAEGAAEAHGGTVTTMSGSTFLALWSPLIDGPDHARRALEAGNRLVADLDSNWTLRRRIRAGVAVHTGTATAELTGTPGSHRFSVNGGALETVKRLAADAPDNQLHASAAILAATRVQ